VQNNGGSALPKEWRSGPPREEEKAGKGPGVEKNGKESTARMEERKQHGSFRIWLGGEGGGRGWGIKIKPEKGQEDTWERMFKTSEKKRSF